MTMLEVEGLTKSYVRRRDVFGRATDRVDAVSGVSLMLGRGETLAIVGESGAGKSTVGRLILRLIEPHQGRILLDGVDLRALSRSQLRASRRHMQMIFQDPFSSLDPRMTIGESVAEPMLLHLGLPKAERKERAGALLRRVGLDETYADRLPAGLSGGQLQRVAIARALTLNPKIIVCDEPVAALDVSVRAQVLNLMAELQEEFGVSYLFISHDLSIVRAISDRVAVMSKGRIVETGPTEQIFGAPVDDYTIELIRAIPRLAHALTPVSGAFAEGRARHAVGE
ncbi:ATP-binding cassette domain-containing protein [Mesorhizobium sp. IMUNJ 23232]|uniref:ATP-binding cassette domain-containing protein n=1 Tax=Mesorhizobium sp. IMUNJ 23232 TaxID=3376064 RepID=UPI003788E182